MNLKNLKAFVINLKRSPERFERMQEKLGEFPALKYERVDAIDGKLVKFGARECNAKLYELFHGKYVTPTEIACFVSHYNALKQFLKTGAEFGLILEDDMEFVPAFTEILADCLKNSAKWNLLKLNGNHRACPITQGQILGGAYRLVFNLFHQSKAGAYLINRHAAHNLVKKLLPMALPIDHELVKAWKYEIKVLSLYPFPSWEEGSLSTIDYAQVNKNRKPWWARFSTYAYRSYIVLRRFIYAITSGMIFRKK